MKSQKQTEVQEQPMPTLHELVQEALSISQALIDSRGEFTADIEKRFDINRELLKNKTDSYYIVDERLEAEALFWKRKADVFRNISKGFEKAQERLRGNIKRVMQEMGAKEISGSDYRFKLSNRAPKLVVVDEAKVPAEMKMIIQTTAIDKEKILAALKDGYEVPGCKLEPVDALLPQENSKKD
jgi:hypothetical protein